MDFRNAQNSHMQHPELGHTMDEETIRKDFEILKQFNFNAVRTSHSYGKCTNLI